MIIISDDFVRKLEKNLFLTSMLVSTFLCIMSMLAQLWHIVLLS